MYPLIFLIAIAASATPGLPDVASGVLPDFARLNDAATVLVDHRNARAIRVDFGHDASWPNIAFDAGDAPWDWSAHAGIRVGLFNPGNESVALNLRVDNAGANGIDHCNTVQQRIEAGSAAEIVLYFNTADRKRFWGMRGIPVRGPMGTGAPLNLAAITGWQLFLSQPESPSSILITSAELFGQGGDLAEKVPFPFIDRYGQYRYMDWPGKVRTDGDLRRVYDADRREDLIPDRDAYGGWTGAPAREATGWFRTEQIDGRWWLITPEGHRFFSAGVNCVGTWERTFIEQRDAWFEWLPEADDGRFKAAFGYARGAHSMAETIGGEGRTFGFYTANLIRAFGPDWAPKWRETAIARLRGWGFNTLGNWSQHDVMRDGDLPFVASLSIAGVRPIEAASGYWARMMDVYDPGFAPAVDAAVQRGVEAWRDNNRCIGYFVDNELAWEGILGGVLASGPDQPARQAFEDFLAARHGDIGALNAAWGTSHTEWAEIREAGASQAAREDLDAFLHAFAARYFQTVKEAIARHAPNQLYLGARFASAPAPAVRACADHADAVSFNLYAPELSGDRAAHYASLGKPVIIGEFHFGATDRGMFHPGLVPVASQEDRGAAYVRYVESLLRHPAVVGAHWFQYVDEPVTGRSYDGENYNIGLVDVTDRPYAKLVESAADLHRRMYTVRQAAQSPAPED
ncbi:MAG: beta-galactosidase [Candidatus Hydrogenedentes bacterium]|nr:beta-galactosidase [Candidatus Hydrogenedentota bacterium]